MVRIGEHGAAMMNGVVKSVVVSALVLVSGICQGRNLGRAAVSLSIDSSGKVTYFVFGSGDTGKLEDLAKSLKKTGYRKVDISAWSNRIDYKTLLKSLETADLQVTSCYVPAKGKAAWFRDNLSSFRNRKRRVSTPVYVRKLIDNNEYNRIHKLPGKFEKVRYVTIHNTAEPFSAMQERDRVDFRRDKQKVSFHYAVDEGQIVQIMPLDTHGWHAADGRHGKGNRESIAIEICRSQCRGRDGYLYERSEENAKLLACALLRHYKLTANDLRMHKDWCGKFCPHRILERGAKAFEEFRQEVAGRLAQSPDHAERLILRALDDER